MVAAKRIDARVAVATNVNLHGARPWHLDHAGLGVATNVNLHGARPWRLDHAGLGVATNVNLHGSRPWHLDRDCLGVATNVNLHGSRPWRLEPGGATQGQLLDLSRRGIGGRRKSNLSATEGKSNHTHYLRLAPIRLMPMPIRYRSRLAGAIGNTNVLSLVVGIVVSGPGSRSGSEKTARLRPSDAEPNR